MNRMLKNVFIATAAEALLLSTIYFGNKAGDERIAASPTLEAREKAEAAKDDINDRFKLIQGLYAAMLALTFAGPKLEQMLASHIRNQERNLNKPMPPGV